MRWIKDHKLISILLAAIFISTGMIVASVLSGGSGNTISKFITSAYLAVEKPVSEFFGGISDSVSGMFSYEDVEKENENLKEENEELKQQVIRLTLSANELKELKELSEVLNYEGVSGTRDIVSADVISMNSASWMNNFTINRGSESGIKEGDVVICGDGLIGRVQSVGKGWAKVISTIDESSKVSFKVVGNLSLIGVVEGASDGKMSGYMLDSAASISEGDMIVTSGMGVYPAGIQIGKVTKVKYHSDSQLKRVTIKPSVEFKSLQKVSVMI